MSEKGTIHADLFPIPLGRQEKKNLPAKMEEVRQFSEQELEALKIVYPGVSDLQSLRIFRELRTQLISNNKKENFVCMVCSPCASGGASYVARNLATAFSLERDRTSLLVDANLYSPSVEDLVPGYDDKGLTDYLANAHVGIESIIYATGIRRMRAIPIGQKKESAAEFFSSAKMESFIAEIKQRYEDRYIFIDSPPVLESSEARILAQVADSVLLVVPYGKVSETQLETAIEVIGESRLVGLVYNN